MDWKIPLFKIAWDEEDILAIGGVIRSGMNWSSGPEIGEFERLIEEYTGAQFAVTFNSGTSALHALLLAHGVGGGDEVIVPSFTFISTANSVLFTGAKPVFADIEPGTYGLDPDDVMARITPKTRCIIPVHYGGCPCGIRALADIAEDHGLILVEDAAEAFGATIGKRQVGTFGDSAMLSFCQNKIITTGEGGAAVTGSREIAEKLRLIRSHGRLETCNYFSTNAPMNYITLGYNYRLSTISAALGITQLKRARHLTEERRRIAMHYRMRLRELSPRCLIKEPPAGYGHVYQIFSVEVDGREGLMKALEKDGIMSKVYFPPVHRSHYYRQVLGYNLTLPVTERVAERILTLPCYPTMQEKEVDMVAASMRSFYTEGDA